MPANDALPAAKTKGVGFTNVRDFVVDRFGPAGWDKVVGGLTPHDRAELHDVLPVGWYSLSLYARTIRAVEDAHGYGDMSLIVQLGRYEAERDLTTIHRVFLRFANPAYTLEKMGDYWRRFHDSGQWVVTRETDQLVTGYLDDWGCIDHALCRELIGYMGRMIELAGAKNVILEHPKCRARGDARCFFRGRWGVVVPLRGNAPEPPAQPVALREPSQHEIVPAREVASARQPLRHEIAPARQPSQHEIGPARAAAAPIRQPSQHEVAPTGEPSAPRATPSREPRRPRY